MTLKELKKKLSSYNDEWLESVQIKIELNHIEVNQEIVGFESIYLFVQKQKDGWETYGDEIPSAFENQKTRFSKAYNGLEQILEDGSFGRTQTWVNVASWLENNANGFLYDSPATIFLMEVHKNYPKSFESARSFITKELNSNLLRDADQILGVNLAYEFSTAESSNIFSRRKAERSSLAKAKSDFQTYLNDSQKSLTEMLKESKTLFKIHAGTLNEIKQEKESELNDWFDASFKKFDDFYSSSDKKITELETTYESLLSLKKPADYWRSRATELKTDGKKYIRYLTGLTAFMCVLLFLLLWLTPEDMMVSFFDKDKSKAIRWSIVFITFVSFAFIGIKALIRVVFSTFHLARDAEERERLTYVYLALLKDSSVEKDDRHLIIQSLFSRADTGLLKDDSSPSMPTQDIIGKVIPK